MNEDKLPALRPAVEKSGAVRGKPFPKGKSPNPGGRPRAVADLVAKARAHTADAVAVIVAALASDDDRVRLMAAGMLLERAYGKPGTPPEEGAGGGSLAITVRIVREADWNVGDSDEK